MPGLFSRIRGKDGQGKSRSKKKGGLDDLADHADAKPRWEGDAYARTTVEPEEIAGLVKYCTVELKARGTIQYPQDFRAGAIVILVLRKLW